LQHGLGLRAEAISATDARELEPALSGDFEAAILRPDEASVDNRALTQAVMEAARKRGVEIISNAAVTGIRCEGSRCNGLSIAGQQISAKFVVIAAGCFSASISGVESYAPVRPAKGQMIALRAAGLRIERVLWSEKAYLVPRNDGRILAGATVEYAGFDKEITAGGLKKILTSAIELAPELARARVEETWAGLRPDSPDHLPILGPTELDGLLISTGHFRSGILLAPITAQLIREWVMDQNVSVDWDRFSPSRFAETSKNANA
jgi:glycine oxidase